MSEYSATVNEIAQLYDWSPAYVRKLSSIHQWRHTGAFPRRYLLADVGAYVASTKPRVGASR